MTFDDFVAREFGPTIALGLALLRDEDDALDVAQETMTRALERWDEVAALDRPGAWSRRVALNLVTDKLRGRTRSRRLTGRLAGRRVDQPLSRRSTPGTRPSGPRSPRSPNVNGT